MKIYQNSRCYQTPAEMEPFLVSCGILWAQWAVDTLEPGLALQAAKDPSRQAEILKAFERPLAAVKAEQGYLTEDIVSLSSETPNLEALLAKFDKPHHHTDDEVRVVLAGHGIFGIIPPQGEAFEIYVDPGDLIIVPAYTRHWFTLREDRHIVALRIFKTPDGWEAIYEQSAAGTVGSD